MHVVVCMKKPDTPLDLETRLQVVPSFLVHLEVLGGPGTDTQLLIKIQRMLNTKCSCFRQSQVVLCTLALQGAAGV